MKHLLYILIFALSGFGSQAWAQAPHRHSPHCVIQGMNFNGYNFSSADDINERMTALGTLATLHYPAPRSGGHPTSVDLTWNDFLFAARMVRGELTPAGQDFFNNMEPARQAAYLDYYSHHATLILWTVINRNYHVRGGHPISNFTEFMRSFSQPINPAWMAGGRYCSGNARGRGTRRCSPSALAARAQMSAMEWDEIPQLAKAIVLNVLTGRSENPNPRAVDFAQRNSHSCSYGNGHRLDIVEFIPSFFERGPGHAFCGAEEPIEVRIEPAAWARCVPQLGVSIQPFADAARR